MSRLLRKRIYDEHQAILEARQQKPRKQRNCLVAHRAKQPPDREQQHQAGHRQRIPVVEAVAGERSARAAHGTALDRRVADPASFNVLFERHPWVPKQLQP